MIIYVVQSGDTIASIAKQFDVTDIRLISDNGVTHPNDLVIGQTIVIGEPLETYTVKEGDTLSDIAFAHGTTIMQLYRNNPSLWDREYIIPGEELIISYDTKATIATNAYAFPYINKKILQRTLPYLTYLSILNYRTLKGGDIESYYDDTGLIEMAKQFGVAPLMLLTSINFRGERNPEIVYDILINPDYQIIHANSMLKVMKEKGYYGVNITITYLSEANQELYINYFKRITPILNKEGYSVFVSIDPNYTTDKDQIVFEKVDYSSYNDIINEAYLTKFFWGTQYGPPMPVDSVQSISLYVDYVMNMIDPSKINIAFPLLGYDWTLPYIQGFSVANAITLDAAIELARTTDSTIQFDEVSTTPYFEYMVKEKESVYQHIVWFADARTIEAIINLTIEKGLHGTGLWNIMSYYPQLWLIINETCKIEKVLPELP